MKPPKSSRIDDPIESSYSAWPDEERGNQLSDLAIAALSPFSEAVHLLHAVKEMFSAKSRVDRILYLLEGFRLKARQIDSKIDSLSGEAKEMINAEIKAKLDSVQFKEALFVAMEETARTLSKERIDRYSSILANALHSDEQVDSPIDLSTLVRDVSQLTDEDVRVLGILQSIFAEVIAHQPNLHDPNSFTEKMDDFRRAIAESRLHPDDFRAICERLSGFGLAAEVLRNTSRMGLNDFCYRPTLRGLKLLKLLADSKRGTQISTK
jgi:hypothetical protein